MAFAVGLALALEGKLPDPNAREAPLTTRICVAYLVGGWFFAVASGYVTAWVARRRELGHALALGGFMVAVGVVYFVARLHADERPEPVWYLTANLILPLFSVPLGGLLRARHVRERGLSLEAGV
jgi:hypothetical protein